MQPRVGAVPAAGAAQASAPPAEPPLQAASGIHQACASMRLAAALDRSGCCARCVCTRWRCASCCCRVAAPSAAAWPPTSLPSWSARSASALRARCQGRRTSRRSCGSARWRPSSAGQRIMAHTTSRCADTGSTCYVVVTLYGGLPRFVAGSVLLVNCQVRMHVCIASS